MIAVIPRDVTVCAQAPADDSQSADGTAVGANPPWPRASASASVSSSLHPTM